LFLAFAGTKLCINFVTSAISGANYLLYVTQASLSGVVFPPQYLFVGMRLSTIGGLRTPPALNAITPSGECSVNFALAGLLTSILHWGLSQNHRPADEIRLTKLLVGNLYLANSNQWPLWNFFEAPLGTTLISFRGISLPGENPTGLLGEGDGEGEGDGGGGEGQGAG
jgi:hypothetical protein